MFFVQWFFGIQIKLSQSSTWLPYLAYALVNWSRVFLRIASDINAFLSESVALLIKILSDLADFSLSFCLLKWVLGPIILSNNVSFFVKLSNRVLSISWHPWVSCLVMDQLGLFLLLNSFGLCKLLPLCHDWLGRRWFESWEQNLWLCQHHNVWVNIIVYKLVLEFSLLGFQVLLFLNLNDLW